MNPPLVLASGSPRRRELLAKLGVDFDIVPSDIPELLAPDEEPPAFARRLAQAKATEVAGRRPDSVVLGADTIVVKNGVVFGKPSDRADAARTLRALSDAKHQVMTAVAVVGPQGQVEGRLVTSEVSFKALGDAEIEAYVDSGDADDKAGAYAIQGEAARFIIGVEGSYSNIVGLPLAETATLLRRYYQIDEARLEQSDR